MREGGEDDLGSAQRSVFRCHVGHLGRPDARSLATLLVGRRERELERGMAGDEPAQLPARIPAGTQDAYRNFMHKECITLHSVCVNDPGIRSRILADGAKLSPWPTSANDTIPFSRS